MADQYYSGANWLKRCLDIQNMSPLGEKVADLLGNVFLGIYHISPQVKRVDWSNKWFIEVNLDRTLSTFDDDLLTRLVLLSHDMLIRVEIRACNFRYLKLLFHPRSSRDGNITERMPTLEKHIQYLQTHYGLLAEGE